ncbi:MAG: DUF1697 domain-containing protein [Candidatus Dojkabacteria bacterium]|nr:DUF1697 domain-containing protein [Candidatus Dojkabacteria bacterium]
MNTYIALLRGINLGGNNIIKMEDLRKVIVNLDYSNVKTYIQSGNVVLQTKRKNIEELQSEIHSTIANNFGLSIPIIVIEARELREIIDSNPFLEDKNNDPKYFHFTFLNEESTNVNTFSLNGYRGATEEFKINGKNIYLYLYLYLIYIFQKVMVILSLIITSSREP